MAWKAREHEQQIAKNSNYLFFIYFPGFQTLPEPFYTTAKEYEFINKI